MGTRWGGWRGVSPKTQPPLLLGKTRYPFYRRLGGLQGQSGQAENFVPTGIRSRTVQPVVSCCTNWGTGPLLVIIIPYCNVNYSGWREKEVDLRIEFWLKHVQWEMRYRWKYTSVFMLSLLHNFPIMTKNMTLVRCGSIFPYINHHNSLSSGSRVVGGRVLWPFM